MYACDICDNDTTTTYYLDCGEIVHACTNNCYTILLQSHDAYHDTQVEDNT